MKISPLLFFALIFNICFVTGLCAADKDAIKKQVDEIVTSINDGKNAEDFAAAAQNKPHYVLILDEGGNTLVHPTLVGKSLKEVAGPVYAELIKATAEGKWVDYIWKEKQKHTYVRKAAGGLIIGSGYSE
jgi:signal transduction histidine kinase